MIALPHNIREMGYHGLRMTAEEYLALGETEERYELVHGTVMMSPSPLPRHSSVALRIIQQLLTFADQGGGIEVFAETDVRFSEDTVYRPDIVAYLAHRLPQDVARLETPPDLVVELLSPSTKPMDLVTKRDDYDRFGAGEYWAVDPERIEVRRWRRQGKPLVEAPVEGDTLACEAIPGLSLDLRVLRRIIGTT